MASGKAGLPAIAVQFRVQRSIGKAVGEVAQGRQANAEDHFQRLTFCEASVAEGVIIRIRHLAPGGDYLTGERGQRFVVGIRQLTSGAQRLDHLGGKLGLVGGYGRVPGHAERAAVGRGGY